MANTKTKRIARHAMAEKKKAVVACTLLVLMGLMWVKVLSNNNPASAKAQTSGDDQSQITKNTVKVTRVELPFIDGRHDVLKRDFFSFERDFRSSDVEVNESVHFDGIDPRVVEKIRLDAIELGQTPQAFINDELVGLGAKLPVRDGDRTFVFEVVSIESNKVILMCDGFEVSLGFQAIESEQQF